MAPIAREKETRQREREKERIEKPWLGERSSGAERFYSGREKNLVVFDFVVYN